MSKEYIERDRPFSLLKNYLTKPSGQYNAQEVIYLVDDLLSDIPAADVVEVRHGQWILFDKTSGTAVCDQCHRQDHFDLLAQYCRYCGARMDGGVNDGKAD